MAFFRISLSCFSISFSLLSRLFSSSPTPQKRAKVKVLNALFDVDRTGCQWRALPPDFPPWSTVWISFRTFRNDGTWQRIHTVLREKTRVSMGREPTPSAALMGEKIRGRKRHLLVDTQGLLMAVKVLEASLRDREGGHELLLPLRGKWPRLQVMWVESGSVGDPFKH